MSKKYKVWWRYEVSVYINGDLAVIATFHTKKHAKIFYKKCAKLYPNVSKILVSGSPMPF